MRALVVGAGAVGQVYGHHLALGGARVAVCVREKYAAEAERGFDLVHIHSKRRRIASRFVPDEVLTSAAEIEGRTFDQIWLAVPTPSLARGELDPVLAASGGSTIVSLQPGMSVARRLERSVPLSRVVFGIIGFQSYSAPLEGSDDPIERRTGPGTAYFFPPFVESTFSGVEDRARDVVDHLRRGGVPARMVRDAHVALSFSSSTLMPIVASLERAGWSIDDLRAGDGANLAAQGAREAAAIVAAETGASPPFPSFALRGPLIGAGLAVGRALSPLDLEAFLRYHFEKVGAQTRAMLDEYARSAEARSLPHEAIDELRAALASAG